MRYETRKLSGPKLDEAVAKAEGWTKDGDVWKKPGGPDGVMVRRTFSPLADWGIAGPLLERMLGRDFLESSLRQFVAGVYGDEVEL